VKTKSTVDLMQYLVRYNIIIIMLYNNKQLTLNQTLTLLYSKYMLLINTTLYSFVQMHLKIKCNPECLKPKLT